MHLGKRPSAPMCSTDVCGCVLTQTGARVDADRRIPYFSQLVVDDLYPTLPMMQWQFSRDFSFNFFVLIAVDDAEGL
jgi:hypothetical protein